MVQSKVSNPWDTILQERIKMHGPEVGDAAQRARGCLAVFLAGNTLKLWNEAPELKLAMLSSAAVKEGQTAALIGKYVDESGLCDALRSVLGEKGILYEDDIGAKAFAAFQKKAASPRTKLQWTFNQLNSLPDGSLDTLILFGAAGHVANWPDFAAQINRVLKNNGRLVIADAPWGGKDFITAINMEMHMKALVTTLLTAIGIKEGELAGVGPDELDEIFKNYLKSTRKFNWQGMYVFSGQKSNRAVNYDTFVASTPEMKSFFKSKLGKTPWDFVAEEELSAIPELKDPVYCRKWSRVVSFGGSVDWAYEKSSSVVKPMWTNLKAKPGDKALVIGEFLERMFVPELQKRVGSKGEIAFNNINMIHRVIFDKLQKGIDVPMAERHQWDYPFADKYPDNYFDLVWLPQGVHHAKSWKEIVPRLMRVLKPGGQFMAIEWRLNEPEFHQALNTSRFLRCIVEKIWWAVKVSIEEMPDYPTAKLVEAFSPYLDDVYELEWKGFLLFWGYKKK